MLPSQQKKNQVISLSHSTDIRYIHLVKFGFATSKTEVVNIFRALHTIITIGHTVK